MKLRRAKTLIWTIKAACLMSLFAFCCIHPARAASAPSHVVSRPELAASRRQELAGKLRTITGWSDLHFDHEGALRFGEKYSGGSPTARELLTKAVSGQNLIVLEDASDRADTVFCRVVEGRWKRGANGKPPVYIVKIDFADFSRVTGDQAALEAFNVGWGVLHEIAHVVHDSADSARQADVGACENLINWMRRECNLAERAEYFFAPFPGVDNGSLMTKLMRLPFERRTPDGKKNRYWVMWDANLVGGLGERQQVIAGR